MFAAIIAVCAQIAVPQPSGVPFTLQTWAIALAGLVLGAKNGTIATLVYVFLGACGAPVFSNFSGGIGVILWRTGGFIVSFPAVAFLAGLGAKKGKTVWVLLGLAAGTVINLSVGLFWFDFVTGFGLETSFGFAVAPFIFVSVVQTAVLPAIGKKIRVALQKAGLY